MEATASGGVLGQAESNQDGLGEVLVEWTPPNGLAGPKLLDVVHRDTLTYVGQGRMHPQW